MRSNSPRERRHSKTSRPRSPREPCHSKTSRPRSPRERLAKCKHLECACKSTCIRPSEIKPRHDSVIQTPTPKTTGAATYAFLPITPVSLAASPSTACSSVNTSHGWNVEISSCTNSIVASLTASVDSPPSSDAIKETLDGDDDEEEDAVLKKKRYHYYRALVSILDPNGTPVGALRRLDELDQAHFLPVNSVQSCSICHARISFYGFKNKEINWFNAPLQCDGCREPTDIMATFISAPFRNKLRQFIASCCPQFQPKCYPEIHILPHVRCGPFYKTHQTLLSRSDLEYEFSGFMEDFLKKQIDMTASEWIEHVLGPENPKKRRKGVSATATEPALDKSSLYAKLNFDLKMGHQCFLPDVQTALRVMAQDDGSCGVTDEVTSSLVLFGGAGTYTGLHVDCSEAMNVAYGLNETANMHPVARWTLFSPAAVQAVAEWLQSEKQIDLRRSNHYIEQEDMHQLTAYLRDHGFDSPTVLYQAPGNAVYVPPGWLHQVKNLQPCLKVAIDVVRDEHVDLYVGAWRLALSRFTYNTEDYMGIQQVVLMKILELV